MRLLSVEYMILIKYYDQTATTRVLYESTDEPNGLHTGNLPISDGLENFNAPVPKLIVPVSWQLEHSIWQWFSFDPYMYTYLQSGTVANTSGQSIFVLFHWS